MIIMILYSDCQNLKEQFQKAKINHSVSQYLREHRVKDLRLGLGHQRVKEGFGLCGCWPHCGTPPTICAWTFSRKNILGPFNRKEWWLSVLLDCNAVCVPCVSELMYRVDMVTWNQYLRWGVVYIRLHSGRNVTEARIDQWVFLLFHTDWIYEKKENSWL